MSSTDYRGLEQPFDILRRFARPRPPVERCDLCSLELGPEHDHLFELATRRLVCTCGACAVLFSDQAGARFKRVPRRVRRLEDFRLTDAQWEDLRLPINLAFFLHSTQQGKVVACYPSPAGATESLLDLVAWDEIRKENPALDDMAPDVEALLVDRLGSDRGIGGVAGEASCFLVPIDQCFRLVGIIRSHWKGFSGGELVWQEIDRFFDDLKRAARSAGEMSHA
jgi:Family of unknown function (DUF5947)